MKRIVMSIITVCMFIPFSNCAQNKQNTKNESAETKTSVAEYRKISAQEAKIMLDENPDAILLDVRSEAEFKEQHIKGAILFPVAEIKGKAANKLPDKNALILIYCRSGIRSKDAANQLISIGYTNVYDFGGIIGWPYETE